ncbi:MAG: hypothetical protein IJY31_03300 [Muribaculaceae bacterium]|nr:hypothetical protein [Muribaculaceae bacterium]
MAKKDETPAEVVPAAESEKKTEKTATEKSGRGSVLEKVGKAAIKEHGLKEAFVASDGTVFRTENDAKNYAANLKNKSILTVKE